MFTSESDSISDASERNIIKVIVYKKGMIYEEGKGQFSVDSVKAYILNDSCIFRPVKK
jgi:hypothetical protein